MTQTCIGSILNRAFVSIGLLIAIASVTATAKADPDAGGYQLGATIVGVEIVDRDPCFARKKITRSVLRYMRLSQSKAFRTNGATNDAHVRWIITNLPDAAGTFRSIGPTGIVYKKSPFWRHPVEVKVQFMVNSVVVEELSRKVRVPCSADSSQFGEVIRELTSGLCGLPEISRNRSSSPCNAP